MRSLFVLFSAVPFLCFSQKQESVDFTKVKVEILPFADSREIYGKGTFDFKLNAKTDSVFLDAVNITLLHVVLNGKEIPYTNSGKRLGFKAPTGLGRHSLFLHYLARPGQTVYFIPTTTSRTLDTATEQGQRQIWTQGQGKYTGHWLPSIDDMNDKIAFELTIIADKGYQVIANGLLQKKNTVVGLNEWHYAMDLPMSSYLAAFVIGDFNKKVIRSKSGIPIALYYEPKDSSKTEPTYRYTKELFDFLEDEIDVPYPWQNYKQVPVQDFLYAGMENTTCTIFSNQYVIDSISFVDKNYVNVNAHELAHQWFGNLVTEESGGHHWLHEGFATYYAYLAEKHLFGDDHFYWKLHQSAKTLRGLSENEGGEALTDPNASSLTFYEKGAWVLVALRERIGEVAFREGIRSYLTTYAFTNATITDFLAEMEKASNMDLSPFKEKWLVGEGFPWNWVKAYLTKKSPSLKLFFNIQATTTDSTVFDRERLIRIWNNGVPKPFKREFIFNYGRQVPDTCLVALMDMEPVEVRQAVALSFPEISETLRPMMESMLHDESYITQEAVLFKLWQAFPENRTQYLKVLDGVGGLPNKNVRQLWLALALVTENFQPENKKTFYGELNGYTSSDYNFEVRQLAFQYLYQIQAMSGTSLKSLFDACAHHVWQFKKTSRNLIRKMNATPDGQRMLESLKSTLSEEGQKQLDTILNL